MTFSEALDHWQWVIVGTLVMLLGTIYKRKLDDHDKQIELRATKEDLTKQIADSDRRADVALAAVHRRLDEHFRAVISQLDDMKVAATEQFSDGKESRHKIASTLQIVTNQLAVFSERSSNQNNTLIDVVKRLSTLEAKR